MRKLLPLPLMVSLLGLGGCQSTPTPPLDTVDYVDLERFMGDWYVVANIPTFLEKDAHNAVESYRLTPEGHVATTFTFRAGGFDGKLKRYEPKGFVEDTESNAVWGMQFMWPIKADYQIIYLTPEYTQTIIGREKRDYVWVMARTPTIPEQDMEHIRSVLADQGYDLDKLQMVPQRWN